MAYSLRDEIADIDSNERTTGVQIYINSLYNEQISGQQLIKRELSL